MMGRRTMATLILGACATLALGGCEGPMAGGSTWWDVETKTYELPGGYTVAVRAARQDDGTYLSQTRNWWAKGDEDNVTSLPARAATRQRMAELCAPGKPELLSESAREELYQRWRCTAAASP